MNVLSGRTWGMLLSVLRGPIRIAFVNGSNPCGFRMRGNSPDWSENCFLLFGFFIHTTGTHV